MQIARREARPLIRVAALCAVGTAACTRAGFAELRVDGVEPDSSYVWQESPITIRGRFPSRTGNTSFYVQLGEVSLESVTYQGPRTLTAVVPAGLSLGLQDVTVTDPRGRSVFLPAAYRVRDSDGSATPGPDGGPAGGDAILPVDGDSSLAGDTGIGDAGLPGDDGTGDAILVGDGDGAAGDGDASVLGDGDGGAGDASLPGDAGDPATGDASLPGDSGGDSQICSDLSCGASCSATCASECNCSFDCSASNDCELGCAPGATCVTTALSSSSVAVDCDAASCDTVCDTVSACVFSCRNNSDCHLGCDTVSSCRMEVDATSQGWVLCSTVSACQAICDNPTDCGGGIIACNRPCP